MLADGLSLPADEALESVFAVIGKRGRGKSGFVKLMMERMCDLRMPFVAFDPVGILWGLRSSFDGSAPGKSVVVIGGTHGDLPIDRRAGAEIAAAVVARRILHVILDLSQEPKAAYRQSGRDFSDSLYAANNESRHVFIEEAPELIPQRLRGELAPTFEAVERLASRGRNRGIGVTLISQRAATVHKDVLACAELLVCFGQTSPQDRQALKEWVQAKAADERLRDFMSGLAGLGRQEGWFWSPEALDIFQKFRTSEFATFHPDRTHLRRHGLLQIVPAMADVSHIASILRGIGGRRGDEDPDEAEAGSLRRGRPAAPGAAEGREIANLHRRIAELEADIAVERRRVAAIPNEVRKAVGAAVAEMSALGDRLTAASHRLNDSVKRQGADPMAETKPTAADAAPRASKPPNPLKPELAPTADDAGKPSRAAPAGRRRGSPQTRILRACASLRQAGVDDPSRVQVSILAGYSPGTGTIGNYISVAHTSGLISYPGGSAIALTAEGEQEALRDGPIHQATEADMDAALEGVLNGPIWRIVSEAKKEFPKAIPRDELAIRCGYSPGTGTIGNYFSRARTLGLIEYVKKAGIIAARDAFVHAEAPAPADVRSDSPTGSPRSSP